MPSQLRPLPPTGSSVAGRRGIRTHEAHHYTDGVPPSEAAHRRPPPGPARDAIQPRGPADQPPKSLTRGYSYRSFRHRLRSSSMRRERSSLTRPFSSHGSRCVTARPKAVATPRPRWRPQRRQRQRPPARSRTASRDRRSRDRSPSPAAARAPHHCSPPQR